jgi:NAD dependent epimerase/dehydratase family enzyme
VISASGVGYYSDRGDELMTETDPPNTDFLAECCIQWENAVSEGDALRLQDT